MLNEGDSVPDVTLESTEGPSVHLAKLERAIVYFYPKDMTPGCTTEACALRDANVEIEAAGWRVYGVSTDSIDSHEKFIAAHKLTFPLLSDPEHRAAEAFGAWDRKSLYGRVFFGTVRCTFAVEKGRILHVWPKVKPTEHAAQVLDWIGSRGQP